MDNPYKHSKIPIAHGVKEAKMFLEKYPDHYFCFYLAHKPEEDWDKSTSRVYMNQAFDNLIYLPVDIEKSDVTELEIFYQLVQGETRVIAINHTQPHKSNVVLRRIVTNTENTDTVFKEKEQLVGYDLNAPAFVEWLLGEIGSLKDKTVLLIGIGGTGEPIAKRFSSEGLNRLVLVNHSSRSELAIHLSENIPTEYHSSLVGIDLPDNDLIVINAAGKEGANEDSDLYTLLQTHTGNIFVDIRPHLDIPIVEKAKELGWSAFTGHGMNARNDYVMTEKLAAIMDEKPPSFEDFRKLVAAAS